MQMEMPMGLNGFAHLRAASIPTALILFGQTFGPTLVKGQMLMTGSGPSGAVRAFSTDEAILEAQEPRKDIGCTVDPIKPVLGFDLRFHAGYDVTVPMRDLAGSENTLTMIFRVTSDSDKDHPIYFSKRFNVPKIEEDAKGDAYLEGTFDVGEGSYHVDWLMRDRSERVCSSFWDTTATLSPKDKDVALHISAGAVQPADVEPFKQEPPTPRDEKSSPLNVKVMVNFAPQRFASATMQPLDVNALVSILRNISREPRICKFSIVAFNMQEQRVLYRQDESEQIDFPALGDSLNSLKMGTVNFKQLGQKHSDVDFLSNLITQEMNNSHADAVIFAGPKVMLNESVSQESLKQVESIAFPVFYMNYNLNPQANPWRDAIGNTVKKLRGYEYTISRPRDLWVAWSDIVTRIVRSKGGRTAPASSSN
jgi:hypothetical protein